MDARPRSIIDRGAYLDAGRSLYNRREKRINVNPKLIVKRDRVTTPMNVRTIPTTKRDTNTRYFLFSDKYDESGSSLCWRSIRRRRCLMDEEVDEEKRLWYEGRAVGALFVHVFAAADDED